MASVRNMNNCDRDWNVNDFYGKYHLTNIKSFTPIPGSQLKIEAEYLNNKAKNEKMREEIAKEKQLKLQKTIQYKRLGAEMQARVLVDTVVGQPIKRAEALLQERFELLNETDARLDSKQDIQKFIENITYGRSHYVSFAVTHGYRSIDWQDDESGNSALHLAVSKGFVEVVGELLKYNCNSVLRNRLGNFPIHQAWLFWRPSANISANENSKQQQKTCLILELLLQNGASPDCTQLNGNTPLHIAARLGPLEAVKTLLGFKADNYIKNRNGQTPFDIAKEYHNSEILKLLQIWDDVKHALVHVDFVVRWQKFLKEYDIELAKSDTAEKIIFNEDLRVNASKLECDNRGGVFQIDDPLLGVTRDLTTTARTATAIARREEEEKPASRKQSGKGSRKGSATATVRGDTASKSCRLQSSLMRSLSPYQSGKKTAKSNRTASSKVTGFTTTGEADSSMDFTVSDVGCDLASYLNTSDGEVFAPSSPMKDMHFSADANDFKGFRDTSSCATMSTIGDASPGTLATGGCDYSPLSDSFPRSALHQRRISTARKVALDGKFVLCTKRDSLTSALSVSRRTGDAPLLGTEESDSRLRILSTTMRDLESCKEVTSRYFSKKKLLGVRGARPKETSIGAYQPCSDALGLTDRERLFSRLSDARGSCKSESKEIDVHRAFALRSTSSISNSSDIGLEETSASIDQSDSTVSPSRSPMMMSTRAVLSPTGGGDSSAKRTLFTSPELLPPAREISMITELKTETANKKKQFIYFPPTNNSNTNGSSSNRYDDEASDESRDIDKDNRFSTGLVFSSENQETGVSSTPPIKYGKSRLKTSHMNKTPLVDPWSTVTSKYKNSRHFL